MNNQEKQSSSSSEERFRAFMHGNSEPKSTQFIQGFCDSWKMQDDHYQPLIEKLREEVEELKQGNYATSSPSTITVNLSYHNEMLSKLSKAEAELKEARIIIHAFRLHSCKAEPFSSRVCELGTKACNINHFASSAKGEEKKDQH